MVVIGCTSARVACQTRQDHRPRWFWLGLGLAFPLLCISAGLRLTISEIPQHGPHDADFNLGTALGERETGTERLFEAVAAVPKRGPSSEEMWLAEPAVCRHPRCS
jgi:hypothetical protein